MAVTNIKPLRKVEADVGTESMEVTVDYRVTCDSLADGPQNVLGPFPLGRIVDGYIKGGTPQDATDNTPTQVYRYPWPEKWCSDPTSYWPSEEGMGIQAKVALFISNVRIVEREKIDRYNGSVNWIVEVTFSRDQEHGADYSIREITPYYLYEDQPQEYGAFLGLYSRFVTTRKPSDGPSQPGEWGQIEDSFINDTVFKGYKSEPDSDEWIPLALSNTVGTPLEPGSLVQRIARPAFKCEWFSYTALDFSDAIGKVNASPYTLVSWDSGWKWPTNSFSGPGADHPAVIFYRCFNPRELLVHTVDCEIVNWSGRRCYKYSVDLIYDRDGHDKYIANVGSDGTAKVGSETVSGGTVEDSDVQGSMSPTQLLKGVDGSGPSGDVFINYDGTPLVKYNANGEPIQTTANAVFMKWRIHEEVEFYDPWTIRSGTFKGNYDFQKASFFQTGNTNGGELGKCPLFYDGGWRYYGINRSDLTELTVPDESTWPDGVCREPEPGNEKSRYKKRNP